MKVSWCQRDELVEAKTRNVASRRHLAAMLIYSPHHWTHSRTLGKSQNNIRSTNVISSRIKHIASSCRLLLFQVLLLLLSIIILTSASPSEVVAGENNRHALHEFHPLGEPRKLTRVRRSPPLLAQQQQQQETNRQVIIPAANPNFEAAFQGECGKNNKNGNPCGHICLDLYDGTYECSCFYGFTLAVDGYSCTPVVDLHANKSGPSLANSIRSSQQQPPAVEATAPEQRRQRAKLVFGQDKSNSANSGHVSGPQARATFRQPAGSDVSFVAAYKSAQDDDDDDDEASDNNSDAKRQASELGLQASPPMARPSADSIGKPPADDNRKLANVDQLAKGAESSGSSNKRDGSAQIIGRGGPDELLRPRLRRLLAASAWLQRRQRHQQESTLTASDNPKELGAPREHRQEKATASGGVDGSRRAITESGKAMTTSDNNKGATQTGHHNGSSLSTRRRLESFYYSAPRDASSASPELIELNSGEEDDGKDAENDRQDADIKSIMLDNDRLVEHLADLVASGGQMDGESPLDHRRTRRQEDMALLELFVNKTMEDYLHDATEFEAESSDQLLQALEAASHSSEMPNQSPQISELMTEVGGTKDGQSTTDTTVLCNDSSISRLREECGQGRGECEWGGQCLMEKQWISLANSAQNLITEQRVSRCQCPIGRGGHLCQKPIQRMLPKFMGRSYLALPMATNQPELMELRLIFKPLEHRRIELRYSNGVQVTRVYGSRDVIMGAWNELLVTPDASNDDKLGDFNSRQRHLEVASGARKLVTTIDNRIVLVTPDRIQLDTGGELANYSTELFVAGLPDQNRRRRRRRIEKTSIPTSFPSPQPQVSSANFANEEEEYYDGDDSDENEIINGGAEGLGAAKGLRGCVGELVVNGRRYNFNSDLNGDALDGFDIAECCEATVKAIKPFSVV